MHTVSFGVLGPLEVRAAGRLTPAPGRATRALLGGLLLTPGESVGEERLAEFAWGPAGASRGALHTSVSRLRSWLRDGLGLGEVVSYAAGRYRLDIPAEAVDVSRFQAMVRLASDDTDQRTRIAHLQAALEEWRGPVLDGAAEWVRADPIVVELERVRTDHACVLADLAVQASRPDLALPHLQRLAGALPYDEVVHARLMMLLGAVGRRAEALRLFEEIRHRLADDLGVDPSPKLRDAHLTLLRDDNRSTRKPPAGAEGRATPPQVPAELPPDVAAFTGRESELDRLRTLLTDRDAGAVAISAVDGSGGIGKSALAIHAAHRLAGAFPDGQLYVNLQGAITGGAPLEPGEVLGRWLRALGDTTPVTDADEATTRFRTAVAGRRLLIVLDNALDATQVRPLLPAAPTCGVLVTSRRILAALEGAVPLHLDSLTPDEAESLLGRIVGSRRVAGEPDAAARIARLCGYLPLALRIAAARLVARPDWPLAALADRLDDAQRRLDELRVADLEVRATFQISYRDLDYEPARSFRLISLLDGLDVGVDIAAALADQPAAQAEAALESLVNAQLVESPTPGRYRMHDLVRLFARERAHRDEPKPERHAAVSRALDCYLATAKQATPMFDPDAFRLNRIHPRSTGARLGSRADAIAWTDTERANLLAAIRQAANMRGATGMAVQLAATLNRPFDTRGYWRELITVNRLAVECAERDDDRGGEALARADLGLICGKVGHLDEEALHLERALAICTEIDDRNLGAAVLNHLGVAYSRQGRLYDTIDCLERASAVCRELGDGIGEARSLNNLGVAHYALGRLDEAITYHERTLPIAREVGNRYSEALALGNMAGAYLHAGQADEAIVLYRQALQVSREVGARYVEAAQMWGVGLTLYGPLGRPEEARECWRESLTILQELGEVNAKEVELLLASPVPEAPEIIRHNSHFPSISDLAVNSGVEADKRTGDHRPRGGTGRGWEGHH